jgi:dimethylargininase
MPSDKRYKRAIVRGVPDTFDRCIKPHGENEPINLELAREQHASYCAALEGLGLELMRLDAEDRFPDCCFVEDTVVVTGDTAVVCEMGAASRRGEEAAVADALSTLRLHRLHRLEPPATMDGGDAIYDGDRLFVGLSDRTNRATVLQCESVLATEGIVVVAVPVTGFLHLKSACTRVAPGVFLVSEHFAGAEALDTVESLIVPSEESYAANCLSVNGTVLVSDGFPRTKELIESRGIPTETLAMTEFRKAGGSLTCLSVLL